MPQVADLRTTQEQNTTYDQAHVQAGLAAQQASTNSTVNEFLNNLTNSQGIFANSGAAGTLGNAAQGSNVQSSINQYLMANSLPQLQNIFGDPSSNQFAASTAQMQQSLGLAPSSNPYAPYMQAGAQAQTQLNSMLGLGPNPMTQEQIQQQYLNTPAVQAQMKLGNQTIQGNYAASGLLGSGGVLQALQQYGQGLAAQTIGNYQSQLAQIAGQGATSSNQYAGNLLSNYQSNLQAQTASAANQTQLAGQQNTLLGQQATIGQAQAQNANNQASSLLSGATTAAQIQANAAQQRESAYMSSTPSSVDTRNLTYGGLQNSGNTTYSM